MLSKEAGTITGDGQHPANLVANPAYLSVRNSQQFTMSADPIYSTVDEDNYQNTLRDNPANFSLKKSVASLDKCRRKDNLGFGAYLGSTINTVNNFYMLWQLADSVY